MSKYSGIDLHSDNCVVAVIDDDDRVCCQKRVPNSDQGSDPRGQTPVLSRERLRRW